MPCALGTSVEAHVCSLVYSTDDVVRSVGDNGPTTTTTATTRHDNDDDKRQWQLRTIDGDRRQTLQRRRQQWQRERERAQHSNRHHVVLQKTMDIFSLCFYSLRRGRPLHHVIKTVARVRDPPQSPPIYQLYSSPLMLPYIAFYNFYLNTLPNTILFTIVCS